MEPALTAVADLPPPARSHQLAARRGLLWIAGTAAAAGVLAGVARLGIAPSWMNVLALEHGPLLVLGAFGTIIGLERAVALGSGWALVAPVAGTASAGAMLAGLAAAPWLGAAASAALIVVNAAIVRRRSSAPTWLMLVGAVLLFLGTLAWASGRAVFEVAPAWIALFVLTIGAERLELSRLTPVPPWATPALVLLATVLGLSAGVRLVAGGLPIRLFGIAVALIGAWQLRFDVARKTVRQRGLPRFSAAGIMLGSGWLVFAGVVVTAQGIPPAGPFYDAVLHAVFVGYVLSMVFAHAPLILPAVARTHLPFHPFFWVALAVLHAGLAVRILGDLTFDLSMRNAGGLTNALALALFATGVALARRMR